MMINRWLDETEFFYRLIILITSIEKSERDEKVYLLDACYEVEKRARVPSGERCTSKLLLLQGDKNAFRVIDIKQPYVGG